MMKYTKKPIEKTTSGDGGGGKLTDALITYLLMTGKIHILEFKIVVLYPSIHFS